MDEWDKYFEELDKHGGVNLNEFGEYHRKSSLWNGASVGVDMDVNEIAYFYLEENAETEFQWQITTPKAQPEANGKPGPLGDGMDYPSHVFEILSSEFRPKPALPGVISTIGMRIIALRGRKPNEVELGESIKEYLRRKFEKLTPAADYITSLNTDFLNLHLTNSEYPNERPIWVEKIEITVLSDEEYELNLFLQ